MGNPIIKYCSNPNYDDYDNEEYNNKKNKNEKNILYDIIFNKVDLVDFTEDINFNDDFQKEKRDLELGQFLSNKFGITYKKDNIIMKDSLFNYFTQTLFRKVGIIILLSEDIKTSINRLNKLLNKLEQKLKDDNEFQKLIKEKCLIFILNEKYEMYSFIMAFADLNKNDLPSILFVKKDFENQEFDGECIKLNTSNFDSTGLFFDTLFVLLKSLKNDDNNIQNKKEKNNYNNFYFDNSRNQKYPENELIVQENHNYFINNKVNPNNDVNFNNNKKKNNDFDNINEIKNDSLNENNINEIKNDSLNENNIEDEKIDNFKNDFDSMNLNDKNNNSIINSINNVKSIKNINNFITDNEINEAKQNLNIEPDEDNENSTEIIIRYPNSGKRASRRFLKEDKIQYLYNYLISLDDFVQEINYQQFYMTQPFPKKYFKDLDESFENYGLYPDGIIDIEIIK